MKFLHIGYPKCASSFLQSQVFTEKNGFLNLLEASAEWSGFIFRNLLRKPSWLYKSAPPPVITERGLDIGISSECLLDTEWMVDLSLVFERLAGFVGNPPVLIVIRKQEDLMYSDYNQNVQAGYFRSYEYFLRDMAWWGDNTIWHRMRYFDVYQMARKHFDRVEILPFELLKCDPKVFLHRLSMLFGREISVDMDIVNPSLNDTGIRGFRMGNRFFRHGVGHSYYAPMPDYCMGNSERLFGLPMPGLLSERRRQRVAATMAGTIGRLLPGKSKGERDTVNNKYRELFEHNFAEQNGLLNDALNLDLEKLGYTGT